MSLHFQTISRCFSPAPNALAQETHEKLPSEHHSSLDATLGSHLQSLQHTFLVVTACLVVQVNNEICLCRSDKYVNMARHPHKESPPQIGSKSWNKVGLTQLQTRKSLVWESLVLHHLSSIVCYLLGMWQSIDCAGNAAADH